MITICNKTCFFEQIFLKNKIALSEQLTNNNTIISTSKDFETSLDEDWMLFNEKEYPISYAYFNAFKNSETKNYQPVFVKFIENNETIGTAYFQIISFKASEFSSYGIPGDGVLSKSGNYLLNSTLQPFKWNVLVSGNMFFTANNGFNFLDKVSSDKRVDLINRTIEHLKNDKTFKFQAILISDLSAASYQKTDSLHQKNFDSFEVDPCMMLKLDENWKTFDDYKSALKSKYRVRANKIIEASKSLTQFEINKENISTYNTEIYNYYKDVLNQADFKMGKVGENYFSALLNADSKNFKIYGYKNEDGLQGFISFAHNYEKLIVHFIGMNYAINKQLKIYNRILLDCIDYGIQNNFSEVNFGRTATELKSTLGAVPTTMFCYVKHLNPLINSLVVKSVNKILKPKSFILRNPYK